MQYTVKPEGVGTRLDIYIVSLMPELSRASIQKLLKSDHIIVNKSPQKTGYILKQGDKINIDTSPVNIMTHPDIDIPVLYEDEDCVVINKPVGVLTHSKGAFNPEATVATFLAKKSPAMSGERAGIVHRLDRATSGVMICAKTTDALSWLQKQFSTRKVKKTYLAIISGHIDPDEAIIDMPIERNPKKPQTFRVGINGKSAQTQYSVLQTTNNYQLLDLKPTTGRTHQLRVHLAQQKHPIVGDTLYDGESADRMYLHAYELEITLPNKKRTTFTASIPASFKKKLS